MNDSDCLCRVTGPDRDGMYDLEIHPACPTCAGQASPQDEPQDVARRDRAVTDLRPSRDIPADRLSPDSLPLPAPASPLHRAGAGIFPGLPVAVAVAHAALGTVPRHPNRDGWWR